MKTKYLVLALLVVAAGGAVALLVKPENSTAQPERREVPAQPVSLVTVERRAVPVTLQAIGTVRPLQTVALKARVDGQIVSVHFNEGQMVAAGDVLFRIDDRSYRIQLRQAEATLANSRVQRELAAAEFKRYGDLLKSGNATPQKFDQVKASLDSLDSTIRASEAAIDSARLNLDYTTIRAPFGGMTGAIQLKAGSMVKANDTTSLVTLTQLAPITVAFSVPERELTAIRRAQAVAPLVTRARPRGDARETPVDGRLTFIDNAIDTNTGTIALKAQFDNDPPLLWPGQFVDVTLEVGAPEIVLVLPGQAVQIGQDGTYVYVAGADGKAALRPVRLARRAGDVAVIAEGVGEGERVVAEGQSRLSDGARYTEAGKGAKGRDAK